MIERMTVVNVIEQETFESRELFLKAEKLIRRGDFEQASVLLCEAQKISPNNPLYMSSMGLCVAMKGNAFAAEKMCRQALADSEDNDPNLLVNLGKVLLEQNDRQNARICFETAYKIDNTNAPAALELSRMGVRKKPILTFLSRNHPINVQLGKLRHRYRLWRNPGLKKL